MRRKNCHFLLGFSCACVPRNKLGFWYWVIRLYNTAALLCINAHAYISPVLPCTQPIFSLFCCGWPIIIDTSTKLHAIMATKFQPGVRLLLLNRVVVDLSDPFCLLQYSRQRWWLTLFLQMSQPQEAILKSVWDAAKVAFGSVIEFHQATGWFPLKMCQIADERLKVQFCQVRQ